MQIHNRCWSKMLKENPIFIAETTQKPIPAIMIAIVQISALFSVITCETIKL